MVIRGGRLIDPASGTDGIRDIIIENDIIKEISDPKDADNYDEKRGPVIDAEGLVVAPGLVDPHVHMRDPGQTHKEDLVSGSKAAARGGFTSVILMGNTVPPVDTPEILEDILKRGRKLPIHIYSCANVTRDMKGRDLTDFKALKKAGAVLMSDDGRPILSESLMVRACWEARERGLIISLHEEDPLYITDNGIDTAVARTLSITGSDRQAEISMIERDIRIAKETGAELTVQHISTKEAVDLIRRARKNGVKIHAEATPHHFTLTSDAVLRYGSLAKMNPPLRDAADRDAIREGLSDGTIEMIATDHAPHTLDEKYAEMFKPGWADESDRDKSTEILRNTPSGITGLETALSLAIRELVMTGILSLPQVIACMSTAPAGIYGLNAGFIHEGGPADIVIFDDKEEWIFDHTLSKSANTPFMGETLPGCIHSVICGGKVIYDKDQDT